jgi:uncharacterized membrane protein YphA (DoxX/SURF4 family)
MPGSHEPSAGGPKAPLWTVLRLGVASVWLFHGLGSKLLDLIPRHRAIVGRIVGDGLSGPVTASVGVAEVLLGLWVASGKSPKACAAVMTAALATMNTLEIAYAKDLLLAPYAMVAANLFLIGLAWYLALAGTRRVSPGTPRSSRSPTELG